MGTLRRDIAFALRTLIKSPVFSLTALVTIALGIGATTAIFSVINTVLLQPLPYDNRDRLAFITGDLSARNVLDFPMAPADFHDLRTTVKAFDEIAGLNTLQRPLFDDRGEARMLRVAAVTPNIFRVLGTRVALGRDFVDEDGAPIGPPPGQGGPGAAPQGPPPPPPPATVILSHEFWQQQFGGDPNMVGRSFQIGNNQQAQVVGILEPGVELLWFDGSGVERRPEVYQTLRQDFAAGSRVNVFIRAIGRLRAGTTMQAAQQEVNALVKDLRQRFPIKETAGAVWRVEPMRDYLVRNTKQSLLTLMGAVVFVLLIACANVANLLLVRTSQRERELAVRSALGGNRTALLRQMLVESLVLALVGGALGVALAWAGIQVLKAIGPQNLPRLDQVGLDPLVLGFTAAAAIASALLFGVVPAMRASRVDVADMLRAGGRTSSLSGAGKVLRAGVVTAEVALAFVLLVGSGLMIRSFIALQKAQPGYDPSGVLTFGLANTGQPSPEARAATVRQIHEKLAALPGVVGVTAATPIPFDGQQSNVRWGTEAALSNPALFQQADFRQILPNYFTVMKTALVDGRWFEEGDNVPGLSRIVIDNVMAAKAFPGERAIGKRIFARTGGPEPEPFEVIGVVRHQRSSSLAADGRETMYVPDGQFGFGNVFNWVIRTSGDPSSLTPAARAAIKEINPRFVITNLRTYDDLMGEARAPTKFALACIGVFAVVAALLAGIGLYGVLSTLVRQRTAEIGVRMAFGASSGSILQLVASQGLKLSVLGIGIGLLAAFSLTRVMSTMLVGVSPTDPLTFAAIAAFFLGVTALACWIPARRAARLDPVQALREE
ncbi:MAG TPA: ABC transporter permease [Gemmatimonadaceae bacterium]|nr:ABC transporter permease [Gemmatimonadaceae bacterium]